MSSEVILAKQFLLVVAVKLLHKVANSVLISLPTHVLRQVSPAAPISLRFLLFLFFIRNINPWQNGVLRDIVVVSSCYFI